MITFPDFRVAIANTLAQMRTHSHRMKRDKWQGIDVSKKPDMVAYELLHYAFSVPVRTTALDALRSEVEPNLPWADDHFDERVGGHPLNPGIQWRNWPWGANAGKFRIASASLGDPTPDQIFDHTYAQRYFPKWAGKYPSGILPAPAPTDKLHRGIYFLYGDLHDVVKELREDPTTRQAILPIFFPEDTGYRPHRRKPCSISYHFMLTPTGLDIFYHLRSCDIIRHFRDDIYLTVRLLLWVLEQLRHQDKRWKSIVPGQFVCYIGNLHCFTNDKRLL